MKNKCVIYINLDGFARYYYEELKKRYPNSFLERMESEGVFFNKLVNALPSITNPCQNQILTGASSKVTHNIYRYYDKKTNLVYQQKRENANKTLCDVALENNLKVMSICHFLLEDKLKPLGNYIYPDESSEDVLKRGKECYHDYYSRLNQLEKILAKESFISEGIERRLEELPDFLVVYCDDLDGIGHNLAPTYGYSLALNEEERISNVVSSLKGISEKLESCVEASKRSGLYDRLEFYITTDHGMTPFGVGNDHYDIKHAQSSLPRLQADLKEINESYNLELVLANNSLENGNIAGVGCNLNLYLSFKDGITAEELINIKNRLSKKEYIYKIFTRSELIDGGFYVHDIDMLIVPNKDFFFAKSCNKDYSIRGQHDSYLPSSHEIYGLCFGKGIRKNYIYNEKARNYDFGTTMAYSLGVKIPNANGGILDIFMKE